MSFQYRRTLFIAQQLQQTPLSRKEIERRLCNQFPDEITEHPRRTFYADKDYIELNFKVEMLTSKRGKFTVYHIESPLDIPESPIVPEDIPKIRRALSILKQLEGLPQSDYLNDILVKLESYNSYRGAPSEEVVSFDYSKLTGSRYLGNLYEAIVNKKTLTIYYKPYEMDTNDISRFEKVSKYNAEKGFCLPFHSYYLKEFNKRWFVLGYTEGVEGLTCLALDRITSISDSFRPYIKNEKIDFTAYFKDIIGVTHLKDYTLETFEFQIQKPRAYYVRTKFWHNSQIETEETPQYITFRYMLHYNRELEARVLEFGKDINVVSPLWFRARIAAILKEATAQYS